MLLKVLGRSAYGLDCADCVDSDGKLYHVDLRIDFQLPEDPRIIAPTIEEMTGRLVEVDYLSPMSYIAVNTRFTSTEEDKS